MQERRHGARHVISFPIRVTWKDENGPQSEEGLTENIGTAGTLIYLARKLPNVGTKVEVTVLENPADPVTVTAEVIRLERNPAHPQVALNLVEGMRAWKKKVFDLAAETVAAQNPDGDDDW
jgi:PilZ domain